MRFQNVDASSAAESTLIGLVAVWAVVGLFNPQSSSAQLTNSAEKFEVATIRVTKECHGGSPIVSPMRLSVHCYTVKNLIERAYGQFAGGRSNPYWSVPKVEGGPSWVHSTFYDIEAKAEDAASRELMNGPMLQNLLEDRFKLKLHRETREVPVYALTVAKGGSKLKSFKEGSCVPPDYSRGVNPLTQPQEFCKARSGGQFGVNSKTVEAQGQDLKAISWFLGLWLDRPVIDRTGLTGKFDVHLEFAPDQLAIENSRVGDRQTTSPASGRSIFMAVQEELGLKLEPSRGPVEILVVDYAEKPSDN